jgi:hypothetical protein
MIHVVDVRADVARGVVAPAERLDHPAVRAQQWFALDLFGVAPDDGLAAAEVEAGDRILVRHTAGQFEDVVQRGFFGLVRVEPGAAEGWTERGRVDADDGAEAGWFVLTENDLFVAGVAGEYAHVSLLVTPSRDTLWGRTGAGCPAG